MHSMYPVPSDWSAETLTERLSEVDCVVVCSFLSHVPVVVLRTRQ